MYQSSEPVASVRAHWLNALAEALDEAYRVTAQLGAGRIESGETATLQVRIIAVLAEVEALRRAGIGEVRREISPNWTNLATWRGNLAEQPKL